jgi:hypothetical protein
MASCPRCPPSNLSHNRIVVIARHQWWRGDLFFSNVIQRLLRRCSPRNDHYYTACLRRNDDLRKTIYSFAIMNSSGQYMFTF